ncbi:hypothetical protein F4777DRAFT_560549 [Nemania sp. FL0916]|nr:hypothetical protein F4777DRAFT_560549 [Nemania sp. FL0916]
MPRSKKPPSTAPSATATATAIGTSPGPSLPPVVTVGGGTLKQRRPDAEKRALLPSKEAEGTEGKAGADLALTMPWTTRNQWVVYAVASGACAAFNGVFAKLTTNDLTTHIAQGISGLLGLQDTEKVLEIVVRCSFFGLNLLFNGVMWTLFTQALAKGTSTTQVSIMNTSTNFVVTALLGLAVFAESLPPLWWVGAALLVAGNVVVGRKDEPPSTSTDDSGSAGGDGDGDGDGVAGTERGWNAGDETRETAGEGVVVVVLDPEGKNGEDEDEDEDVPLLGDLEARSSSRDG